MTTTLRAMECLVAVLEHGSLTEAAAKLHMSQPALSHQIAALERTLGTPVVERLPRGVRPTVAGRAVLADARAALAAADRVVSVGRAVARGAGGSLRIGCAESMTAGLLAPVLRVWHRRYPDVEIDLTEMASADALADLVSSGQVDIAICPRPSKWDGHSGLIGREEIVVTMNVAAALTEAGTPVAFADIAGHPVVHYHRDNGLRGWLDELAARHGVVLTAATRTRQAATAAQLAAAGLGVALVPTTALTASYSGAVRRLEPMVTRDVVALTMTADDAVVQRFEADVRRRGFSVPGSIVAQLGSRD